MVSENTLRIKHFPAILNDNEREDFLKHFGAIEVKSITSKVKQKSVVFARFKSPQITKSVLHRLHQLKLFDSFLCVEYARDDIITPQKQLPKDNEDYKSRKYYKQFLSKINAFNSSFNQPPPPYLKYSYPKANRATINNIAHALASIPKFYTQVLHLMNRMNLPPPFSNVPDTPIIPQQSASQELKKQDTSESEIESDPEMDRPKDVIPAKRTLPQKKMVKRPKFIKPATGIVSQVNKEKVEEVFEKVDLQSRKIEMKVSSECLGNPGSSTNNTIEIIKESIVGEETKELPKRSDFIPESELNANRIPLKDLSILPVFKDYHPGIPSCRLYIKNIAKSIEKSDLEYIYKRYEVKKEGEDAPNQFDIRLMQEGRMKGQAFVTLQNVDIAQKALKETNGFMLKEKPLVVVFARSVVQKK